PAAYLLAATQNRADTRPALGSCVRSRRRCFRSRGRYAGQPPAAQNRSRRQGAEADQDGLGRRLRVHGARRKSVTWRPFSTLTGRLVLVTIVAVAVSYAVALVMFSNERGAALRRAAETTVIERVAYTTERLRESPAPQREAMVRSIRDF